MHDADSWWWSSLRLLRRPSAAKAFPPRKRRHPCGNASADGKKSSSIGFSNARPPMVATLPLNIRPSARPVDSSPCRLHPFLVPREGTVVPSVLRLLHRPCGRMSKAIGASFASRRPVFSDRINCPSRKRGTPQIGGQHDHAARFPSIRSIGNGGRDARPGPNRDAGGQSGRRATHATVPDFSRVWSHPSLPWFEPPASGPGPVTNRSRGDQRPAGASGSPASPSRQDGVRPRQGRIGD